MGTWTPPATTVLAPRPRRKYERRAKYAEYLVEWEHEHPEARLSAAELNAYLNPHMPPIAPLRPEPDYLCGVYKPSHFVLDTSEDLGLPWHTTLLESPSNVVLLVLLTICLVLLGFLFFVGLTCGPHQGICFL